MAKAVVIIDLPKPPFRSDQGWEAGFLSKADANATETPEIPISTNNDVDIVIKRMGLVCLGSATAGSFNPRIPNSVKVQIRDSGSDYTWFREPASLNGFGFMSFGAEPGRSGRFAMNDKGLPSPYILRRAHSVIAEIHNEEDYVFPGDLFFVMEGFRVYPGELEPVPDQIKGVVNNFSWNGHFDVPADLADGFQRVAQGIELPGLGRGKYFLKSGSILTNVAPGANNGSPSDLIGINLSSSKGGQKPWVHTTNAPQVGQYMPASFFTGGDTGFPWVQPVALGGNDRIFLDLYTDPAAWVAGNGPGRIEIQLNGVRVD